MNKMGKPLSVDEHDLLNFFATDPKPVEADISWDINCNEYLVEDGAMQLSFTIEPYSKYVSLLLHVEGFLAYILASQHSIWLTVKPKIAIRQFSSSC